MRATPSVPTTTAFDPLRLDVETDERATDVVDRPLARVAERQTKSLFRAKRRIERRSFQREGETELGIAVEQRQRASDQLSRLRDPRLLLRVAALRKGEDGERGGEREADQRTEGEQAEPTMTASRFRTSVLDGSFGVVAALPAEHSACEDVVEDLPAAALVGAEDAVIGECGDDRLDRPSPMPGEVAPGRTPRARSSFRTA